MHIILLERIEKLGQMGDLVQLNQDTLATTSTARESVESK